MTWEEMWNYVVNENLAPDRRIEKTNEEWKELLTSEQYRITRTRADEKPFQGNLHSCIEVGQYVFVVRQDFSILHINLTLILAGPVLPIQL